MFADQQDLTVTKPTTAFPHLFAIGQSRTFHETIGKRICVAIMNDGAGQLGFQNLLTAPDRRGSQLAILLFQMNAFSATVRISLGRQHVGF